MSDPKVSLTDEFETEINAFIAYSNDVDLAYSPELFHNSSGTAVAQMNSAIASYELVRPKIVTLFEATSTYLTKARDNIDECEIDNSVDSGN